MTKIIVSGILIDELWRILLIKRKYNKKNFPNFWAFPWWNIEKNETLEDWVIREVKEEVWLNFEVWKLYDLYQTKDYDYYKFLWNFTWNILIQEIECDWYWWFSYEETKNLHTFGKIQEILQRLNLDNLLK